MTYNGMPAALSPSYSDAELTASRIRPGTAKGSLDEVGSRLDMFVSVNGP